MMAAGEEPNDEELQKRADNSDTEKAALAVDYLVVGAGLASLAFLDELLSLDSKATFALVDKNEAPGGHWNFAYPFVRLHQPAAYYGVSSEPLAAGAKRSCMMTFEPYDNKDLADKEKLLAYFARAVRRFEATGRVQYFARATFSDGIIACADGSKRSVNVVRKLVLPASNVVVPAMRPPAYAVAEGVDCGPANILSSDEESGRLRTSYVVVGAGKTGVDSVLLLLRRGVPASAITWVVSQDCWYFLRDYIFHSGSAFLGMSVKMLDALNECSDSSSFFHKMEAMRLVGRLDPSRPPPTTFRGATVDIEELELLRTVEAAGGVVRLGRVTAIDATGITLQQGHVALPSADTLVVDCSANGTDGYAPIRTPFEADRIHLTPCYSFNIGFGAAILAWLEKNVETDERKNANVFTIIPEPGDVVKWGSPALLPLILYGQFKMDKSLERLGASSWMLTHRTHQASMKHISLCKLLWAVIGPTRLMARRDQFLAKMEAGGFTDVQLHRRHVA